MKSVSLSWGEKNKKLFIKSCFMHKYGGYPTESAAGVSKESRKEESNV